MTSFRSFRLGRLPLLASTLFALVLGAEDEGMRRLTREACDLTLRLPQTRNVESLNVSVAAAVLIHALSA